MKLIIPYEVSEITKVHGCAGDRQDRSSNFLTQHKINVEYASDIVDGETKHVTCVDCAIEQHAVGDLAVALFKPDILTVFYADKKDIQTKGAVSKHGQYAGAIIDVGSKPFAMVYNPKHTAATLVDLDGCRAMKFSPAIEGGNETT